jgi:hypothetical protein
VACFGFRVTRDLLYGPCCSAGSSADRGLATPYLYHYHGLEVRFSGRATLHSMLLLSAAIQKSTVSGCTHHACPDAFGVRVHVGTNATTLQLSEVWASEALMAQIFFRKIIVRTTPPPPKPFPSDWGVGWYGGVCVGRFQYYGPAVDLLFDFYRRG